MITSDSIIKEPKAKEETPKVATPEVKKTEEAGTVPTPATLTLVEEIEGFLKTVENQSNAAITYLIKLLAHHKEVTK